MTARDDAIAAILAGSQIEWDKSRHTLSFGEILDTAVAAGAIMFTDRLEPVGWHHTFENDDRVIVTTLPSTSHGRIVDAAECASIVSVDCVTCPGCKMIYRERDK